MKTPSFWQSKNLISTCLLPASWLYAIGSAMRAAVIKPTALPVPIICIGNLTAGGGGKTPLALHIGNLLKQRSGKAVFLSRGYGGALAGPVLVDTNRHSAAEVGDEPLLLAQVLPTIVAADRVAGARHAVAHGAKVIVMDDGFQNPSLKKDLSLLVIDGRIGLGNGRLLPAGPLRQTQARGIANADAVVLLNAQPTLSLPAAKPVLSAQATIKNLSTLQGKNVVAFCGLAWPEKFFRTLSEAGIRLVESRAFADHHRYSEADINPLISLARQHQAILATTAKDAVRLPSTLRNAITVLDVAIEFDNPVALAALLEKALHAKP